LVKRPFKERPSNSTIAFKDNSSSLRGFQHVQLLPHLEGADYWGSTPGAYREAQRDYDVTLTVETHNFPCGIAPFPGAETGAGGRIRDGQSTGQGSLVVAAIAGYACGNLQIPGYDLPWETKEFAYPSNMASPLQIIIDCSNGASDYGNKFGEPLICGFTRTMGQRVAATQERFEWVKPIMLSGGIGQMDHAHCEKREPEKGQLVVKIGGPAYRIGVGGGAASSMVAGDNAAELDFNAVQRGDAEME
jgi:phosphoribosylformylglycinamidine synthase